MTTNRYLFEKIKSVFDFNGYEIDPERLKIVVLRSEKIIEKHKTPDGVVIEFFEKLEIGELGMIYKNPMSFLIIFSDYCNKNSRVKLSA